MADKMTPVWVALLATVTLAAIAAACATRPTWPTTIRLTAPRLDPNGDWTYPGDTPATLTAEVANRSKVGLTRLRATIALRVCTHVSTGIVTATPPKAERNASPTLPANFSGWDQLTGINSWATTPLTAAAFSATPRGSRCQVVGEASGASEIIVPPAQVRWLHIRLTFNDHPALNGPVDWRIVSIAANR